MVGTSGTRRLADCNNPLHRQALLRLQVPRLSPRGNPSGTCNPPQPGGPHQPSLHAHRGTPGLMKLEPPVAFIRLLLGPCHHTPPAPRVALQTLYLLPHAQVHSR